MGGRGIMRRVNEFFRQDVKIRSNRSKEEYPPPAIYHVSREIMIGRGLVGGGIHVGATGCSKKYLFLKKNC